MARPVNTAPLLGAATTALGTFPPQTSKSAPAGAHDESISRDKSELRGQKDARRQKSGDE